MKTKPFAVILVLFLAIGGLAGSLTGVFTSGDNDDGGLVSAAGVAGQGLPTGGQSGTTPGGAEFDPERIREQLQSGELTQEDLANIREQFQGQAGGGGGAQQGSGTVTRTGIVASVDGSTIFLTGFQGDITVTIGGETAPQQFRTGSVEELSAGQQVTVIGQRGDQGVVARSIVVTPAGADLGALAALGGRGRPAGGGGFGGFGGGQNGFGGGGGTGGTQGGFGGAGGLGGGLAGTIDSVGGGTLTVNTEQGPLAAIINDQTVIQMLVAASLADVALDSRIVVTGTSSEDGSIAASSILIIPAMTGAAITGGDGQQAPGDGQPGPGGAGGGFGGGGLAGEITGVQGSTLTIETADGPRQVDLGPDTVIRIFSGSGPAEGSLEDLTDGAQVRVIGEEDDGGVVQAQTVIIVPAGFGGRGGFWGGGAG